MMLSSHPYLGLPLGLAVKGFHSNIFLVALTSGILFIRPNHFSVVDYIFVLYQFVKFFIVF